MLNDLRFGLRQLMKSPGFTLITVFTLAIGIGANTAIFSMINAYLIKPLPYGDPDRLVSLWHDSGTGNNGFFTHGKLLADIEANSEQIAAFIGATSNQSSLSLTGIGTPKMLNGLQVTGPLLKTLGLSPTQGQDFSEDHQSATGDHLVVLLSENVWKQYLNSDPDIVGKSIVLGHQSYTVIGLFEGKPTQAWIHWASCDFLIPAALPKHPWKENYWEFYTLGRLAPDASVASATQEIAAIKSQFSNRYSQFVRESKVVIQTLRDGGSDFVSKTTYSLLIAVGLVLLIACANVANLLFARATARQSELALRTAIGASGWRIVRLLLCESTLLSLAGAAGGLIICINSLPLLNSLVDLSNWPEMEFAIDFRVLAFTLTISVATGLLFGVFPAIKVLREGSARGLNEMGRSFTRSRGNGLQASLIVCEIALSVVLLVSIGLLLKSTNNALNEDRGFDESNSYSFIVARNPKPIPEATNEEIRLDRTRFSTELVGQLKQIPGVENATMISQPPMDPRNGVWRKVFWRDDQPDAPRNYTAGFLTVNGDAFSILDIPLIRGRLFDPSDQRIDAQRIAIIDEILAKEKFPDTDPIGHTIHIDGLDYQVVGIVGSIISRWLDEGKDSVVYAPQIHSPWNTSYLVKSRLTQSELEGKVLQSVATVDPDQPIGTLNKLEQLAKDTLNYRYVINILIALFGAIAILLASIGIYGLMTHLVEQRTREIGIRLAIGAFPHEIIGMVLKRGIGLAAIGIGTGLACGVFAMLILAHSTYYLLYHVSPYDPIVLVSVAIFVFLVTAFASWRPARSASTIHPSQALQLD
ncbi:ABC transporter permease [Pelagicoccus mobilis]|uniref:ABC transporter permease n=1 Tax=Pelagicoccus mobilis TaxID=415221 RepID=A0A934VP35_9BACT|nr:ABC transporter permease [Pelagicoccus mobilis]MBK1876862.1 ABC transporter permease [Pelagicoccus mobilis]